ncbi:MAG: hypothetical protein K0R51_2649 [Cytophagaceae bacterium]|jgi:hypothetical protein|nr:hypothetical protein [Cytophagaceae bacterium]
MKHFFLLLALLFAFAYKSSAQTWEKYYGTNQQERGSDIIATSDGAYLATASASSPAGNSVYVVKTDTSGNILWSKYIPNAPYASSPYVIESDDHFYYVSTYGCIIKLTPEGDIVWKKNYGSSPYSFSNIAFDAQGDLLTVNNKSLNRYSKQTGDFLSSKTYDKGNFNTILKTTGGYLLGGADINATQYNQFENGYFLKVDNNLDSLWGKTINASNSSLSVHQIVESNGYYYASGSGCGYNGTNCWYNNSVFFCLSASGDSTSRIQTGAGYSGFKSMAVKNDGSVLGLGYYGSSALSLTYFTLRLFPATPQYNQLQYLSENMRFHLLKGERIVPIGNNRFIAVASIETAGHGGSDLAILKLDANLVTNTNTVSGSVYYSNSQTSTCSTTTVLTNEIMKVSSPALGTVYTKTDAFGKYSFQLPDGDYTVTHVPSRYKYIACPSEKSYAVSLSPATPLAINKHFYDSSFVPASAPLLQVQLSGGATRRPCFKNSYTVYYSNLGTQTANAVQVVLTLDPLVIPLNSSMPFVKQNDTYTFNVGNLAGKASGTIKIVDSLACINSLMGQTKCAQVRISYDTLYELPSLDWDKSSVIVKGYCDGHDSVRFVIKNTGEHMAAPSQYRLYESDGLRLSDVFQLNANDSLKIAVYANGATYRLEADQSSGHPPYSFPSVTIEACGKDIEQFPSGYVTSRAPDDSRFTFDEFCSRIVNSYDPNEKSVVPAGLTDEHFIKDNTRLKYHVDFQNTGTDVAYTVVIRDTLSEFLDPASILFGAASHPYEWDITGKGILTMTFNNINLPDSNANEKDSHGYISFEIAQQSGNPLGTVIRNTAAIYFDYNDPIITNTVFNTVNNDANPPIPEPPAKIITSVSSSSAMDLVMVYPNPAKESAVFQVSDAYEGNFNLVIKDMTGREVFRKENISGNRYQLSSRQLSSGVLMYSVYNNEKELGKGKIIILD